MFTVTEFVTAYNAVPGGASGTTSIAYMADTAAHDGHMYTVFKIVSDGTAGITAGEVTLLGTMHFDSSTNPLVAGNLVGTPA